MGLIGKLKLLRGIGQPRKADLLSRNSLDMDAWNLQPAHDHGLPLTHAMRSLRRESGLIATGLHLAWWTLVRGYMIAWHRLTIVGSHQLPKQPPFILVANHASHLDALVLASPLNWRLRDRIFPIAAGDVF